MTTPTDTRQAVDAARDRIMRKCAGYDMTGCDPDAECDEPLAADLLTLIAAVRADERARRNAEIGAASQDETENRP